MGSNVHISLAAEPLFHIGSFPVYNSYLSSLIIILFLIFVGFKVKNTGFELKSRLYNFVEMLLDGAWSFLSGITGDRALAREILPWIFTFFIFIALNNWFGLVPGVGSLSYAPHSETAHAKDTHESHEYETGAHKEDKHASHASDSEAHHDKAEESGHHSSIHVFRAANSDINMTLALALVSVILTQYLGFKKLGLKGYGGKFLNFTNPILFFVGILEIISETVKIFSFSFRLFGNVFAGEVLLAVILSLVPVIAPIPFYGVEFFAGFIQAVVFSMLSVVFINTAVAHH